MLNRVADYFDGDQQYARADDFVKKLLLIGEFFCLGGINYFYSRRNRIRMEGRHATRFHRTIKIQTALGGIC
jgi:hypothetical protein